MKSLHINCQLEINNPKLESEKSTLFSQKNQFKLLLILMLSFLFVNNSGYANSIIKCDSIIKSGVQALNDNKHILSLELLTQARLLAEKNRWYKQEFLAINNIGANYYMLLEYGEALNYYLEAYTIALKHLEPKHEMIVLNNIAILYSKEKKHQKANEYFKKAFDIAKVNNDNAKMGLYAMNLGSLANDSNNPKLARSYFTEASRYILKDSKFLNSVKIGLAECDLFEGKTKSARNIAQSILNNGTDLEFNNNGISSLTIISKAYLKEDNLEKATLYCNLIMQKKLNLDTKTEIFELFSEINFKKKNYEVAFRYKDSIIDVNSKLNEIKNTKLYESSKVKFEIQNYKNQIFINETELKTERKIFYSIITIIIIIVIFIVWSLRNLSVKHKQKKIIAEVNEQILTLELENKKSESLLLEKQIIENKTISLLEQELLKNEVESKNRKLSAKALYLSGRNQMIEEVLQELSKISQVAKDVSLVNHIQSLKNHLNTDKEWDNFITHFEEVNQNFLISLKAKHPTLAANDIRFISYIYMNLSTKEIASMLNIAPESCRKRKERIAAKMKLPEHTNLYDYLASI